jgi:DNA-binding winged helix-turn-helix (wHTH) protein
MQNLHTGHDLSASSEQTTRGTYTSETLGGRYVFVRNAGMTYRFGDHVLDTRQQELRRRGVLVPLEPKSYLMLIFFVSSAGRLISKDELLRHVWPGVNVDETAVRRCIRNIRRALGETGFEQGSIETRHGRGYRFLPQVTVDSGPEPVPAGEPELDAQTGPPRKKYPEVDPTNSLLETAILLSQSAALWSRQLPPAGESLPPLGPEVFFSANFGTALAVHNHGDHKRARTLAQYFQVNHVRFVTTRTALLEMVGKVSEVLGPDAAFELLDASEDDENLEIIPLSDDLYVRAKRFAERHGRLKHAAEIDLIADFVMHQRDVPEAMPKSKRLTDNLKPVPATLGIILLSLGCSALAGLESWSLSNVPALGNTLGQVSKRFLLFLIATLIACLAGMLLGHLLPSAPFVDKREASSLFKLILAVMMLLLVTQSALIFWILR